VTGDLFMKRGTVVFHGKSPRVSKKIELRRGEKSQGGPRFLLREISLRTLLGGQKAPQVNRGRILSPKVRIDSGVEKDSRGGVGGWGG